MSDGYDTKAGKSIGGWEGAFGASLIPFCLAWESEGHEPCNDHLYSYYCTVFMNVMIRRDNLANVYPLHDRYVHRRPALVT